MIEKMLNRMEELRGNVCAGIPCNGCEYNKDCYEGEHAENRAIDLCKKIVKEVAKEYGNASDNDLAVVSALPSLYPLQPFEEEAIHKVVASAKDGGWIPCEKGLPPRPKENPLFENKPLELYLTTIKGADYPFRAFWNGKYFTDGWGKVEAIAWMPLPPKYEPKDAPYQKGE